MGLKKLSIIFLLFFLFASPVRADTHTVSDIAKQLMCSCGSCELVLSKCDCPTQEEAVAIIEQKLAQGESQQEILDFFVAQYGAQILVPPLNPVLLISAITGILAVGVVIYLALKKRARGK